MNQKQSGGKLVFLNFVTDKSDPLLGFSHDWIDKIRQHFDHTTVVSGKIGIASLGKNVDLVEVGWERGQSFRNFFRSLWKINSSILKSRPHVVFTHMNYWFSIFAFPASLFVGARRVLWYAHHSGSISLWVAALLNNLILTSVDEAFPYKSRKVRVMGQAVDETLFLKQLLDFHQISRYLHFGRLDEIKRVPYIIECLEAVQQADLGNQVSFTHVGSPSNPMHTIEAIIKDLDLAKLHLKSSLVESVPRIELEDIIKKHQVFVHARPGSLDKAPLEAALSGLIVISDNPRVFQVLDSKKYLGEDFDLTAQLVALRQISEVDRKSLQHHQRENVLANHSISTLGQRFISAVAKSQS